MSFGAGAQKLLARVRTGLAGFRRDRRGIAAIEFALIAPILLAMYFLTMEASQAIETNKKLSRVSSMVADLVAQQSSVTKSDLDAIMKIADSTLLPYQRSKPTIIITGIDISGGSAPAATVNWSRKIVNGTSSAADSNGKATSVPASLMLPNTFLVRVEGKLGYKPVISWNDNDKSFLGLSGAFDLISMGETYYLRPRMTASISCSDCYK